MRFNPNAFLLAVFLMITVIYARTATNRNVKIMERHLRTKHKASGQPKTNNKGSKQHLALQDGIPNDVAFTKMQCVETLVDIRKGKLPNVVDGVCVPVTKQQAENCRSHYSGWIDVFEEICLSLQSVHEDGLIASTGGEGNASATGMNDNIFDEVNYGDDL